MKNVKSIDHDTYYKACDEMDEKLRDMLGDDYRRIEVFNRKNFEDRTVNFGINWAAIGTVDPERAVEFATKMMQVAEIVEQFPYNGYVVTR